MLRICFLSVLVGAMISQCGCSEHADPSGSIDLPTQVSTTSAQATPDPGLVSPDPTQNLTTQSSDHDPEVALQVKQTSAPELVGADKSIMERDGIQRIVYLAKADNPYGYAKGDLVGEYKYEVILDELRTGGLALAAPVVRFYLDKALADMPADQDHWLLTLPVDLSDCRSLEPILIDRSAEPFIDRPYYIRISAPEELGVVNILDAQQEVVVGEFGVYDLQYVISQTSNESMRIIEGQEMAFLFVIINFQTEPQQDMDYTFGDRLGTTREPVLAGLTSVRGPMIEHDFDCILKIENCPVFLMANEKP